MKKYLWFLLAGVLLLCLTTCKKGQDVFAEGDLLYDIGAKSIDLVEEFAGREEVYARSISFAKEEVKLLAGYKFQENCPSDLIDDLFLFPATKQMNITVNGQSFPVYLLEDCRIVVRMTDGYKVYGAEKADLFTQDMFYGLIEKYRPQTEATQSTTVPENTGEEKNIPETGHTYTLVPAQDDPYAKFLTIKDGKKEIQTLRLEPVEWFIAEPVFADITFDGHKDILVPFQRLASGAFFAGYVWDGKTGQYVYTPSLENIPNIALDTEKELLLSYRTASQSTSYGMHRYNSEKRDFEPVRSLYWEPAENDGYVRVVESQYTDGKEEQANERTVIAADSMFPDKTDAMMAPYYEAGSVWDLDSGKWQATLYTP